MSSTEPAKVALTRITIAAPPEKVRMLHCALNSVSPALFSTASHWISSYQGVLR